MTFIGRFFRGGSGEPARIVGGKLARIVSVKQVSDKILKSRNFYQFSTSIAIYRHIIR